jgi:RNA polymerase sigma factor (sigma-70 family)
MTKEEREVMIVENMPLVGYALNLLEYDKSKYDDYFQQGCLQLIRCVDNFKPESGKKFSTYAVKNIKWFLKEYIQRDLVVKPPVIGTTGRVRKVEIDSFEKIIYNDGERPIRLEDVLCLENSMEEESDIEFCLKELLNKEDITLEEYEIFIERIIEERGVRTVASAHNITMKEVKHIVKNTIELLKVKYKMLFPDTYEVMNNSYNKN